MTCVYLRKDTGRKHDGLPIFECQIHEKCCKEDVSRIASCHQCKEKLALDDDQFADRWEDSLIVLDRRRDVTNALRGFLAGTSVFLACGGPSAKTEPLEQLYMRGVWTLAVNNMAAHPRFRPQAFVCSDGLIKFSSSIWLDPGIMKFVPSAKFHRHRNRLRRKTKDGKFEFLDKRMPQCPNVWGFRRRGWFQPDDSFFLEESASWGNLNEGVKRTGLLKTVNTSLLAIRLLRYLGARQIFLLGADFWMRPDYGYSFEQARTMEASRSNNAQFEIVNGWLCEMETKGVFHKFGVELYNCCRESGLRAFPFVAFEDAVKICQGQVEEAPDLSGWYEKNENPS